MITPDQILGQLPPFKGQEVVVSKNQTTKNIINEVLNAHTIFALDYAIVAKFFTNRSPDRPDKQLYDFCKEYLHYNVETDRWQTTRSPAGILALGQTKMGVDCKHYAGFIGGTLDAMNREGADIDWEYRFASYDRDKIPGHVFIVIFDGTKEIWVDPVLDEYNGRYPYPNYYIDKKSSSMPLSRLSGMKRMGSTASTEQVLTEIAPALSAIPVVGYPAAVADQIASAVLTLFPSRDNVSWVDWLIQLYDYYVLGKSNVTSDNSAIESDKNAAQTWFSYVLGVPVGDRYLFDALKGVKYGTATSLNQTAAQRAQAYLTQLTNEANSPSLNKESGLFNPEDLNMSDILKAVAISNTLQYSAAPGGWAGAVAAPNLYSSAPDSTGTEVLSTTPTLATGGVLATIEAHPIATGIAAILAIWGIYELTKST